MSRYNFQNLDWPHISVPHFCLLYLWPLGPSSLYISHKELGTVEDTHAITATAIFKFEVCTIFFLEKRKNITVNLGIFASYLSKEKSSAHRFSPGARFILL